jgi:hypothetical protein
LNGASIFGRIIPPLLVPRIGIINMTIICGSACGILIFCTLAVHDVPGTIVFALLYGFFSGACEFWTPYHLSLANCSLARCRV